MHKLQQNFNQYVLSDLFSVDVFDKENCYAITCMPNSYEKVLNIIDTLYKVFAAAYVDQRKWGTLNKFICDFVQDSNGIFYFLKINDFSTDQKPIGTSDWKVSTDYSTLKRQKYLNNLAK